MDADAEPPSHLDGDAEFLLHTDGHGQGLAVGVLAVMGYVYAGGVAFIRFVVGALIGPACAHAAHKALLRAWANGGVQAADEVMFNIAMPLFETEDVKAGLASATQALTAGTARPVLEFKGC